MPYINSILNPNEEVIVFESMSFNERAIAVSIWAAIAIVLSILNKGLGVLAFFFVLYILMWCIIANIGFENVVTTERVIVKRGIIRRDLRELPFSRIETCEFTQSIMGRIFDFGTVIVSGTGNARIIIGIIDHPANFRQAIAQKII